MVNEEKWINEKVIKMKKDSGRSEAKEASASLSTLRVWRTDGLPSCPLCSLLRPVAPEWVRKKIKKKKFSSVTDISVFLCVNSAHFSTVLLMGRKWKDEVPGVIFLKQLCSVRSTQPFFLPPCCTHKYHGAINNLFHYKKWSSITEGLINPQGIDLWSEKAIPIFPGRCCTQCFRMSSC